MSLCDFVKVCVRVFGWMGWCGVSMFIGRVLVEFFLWKSVERRQKERKTMMNKTLKKNWSRRRNQLKLRVWWGRMRIRIRISRIPTRMRIMMMKP